MRRGGDGVRREWWWCEEGVGRRTSESHKDVLEASDDGAGEGGGVLHAEVVEVIQQKTGGRVSE